MATDRFAVYESGGIGAGNYRFFQISPVAIQEADVNLASSGLMFSLRLYEPLRRRAR